MTLTSNSGDAPSGHPGAFAPGASSSGEERIARAFEVARGEGRAALMPYMMAGFPDQEASLRVADAYVEAGADLIELGVPFSDPLADGPTIHAAATEALAAGATLRSALEVCEAVSDRVAVVLMAYANMVIGQDGVESFVARAAGAGAAGAIVPDLPLDEAASAREAFEAAGLALVPLLAPTTPEERRGQICRAARGFVYLVSTIGTTGERQALAAGLADLVAAARKEADVPVAVGFGIGTPEQAAEVGAIADGVIIGSRLVRAAAEGGSAEGAAAAVTSFLRDTRAALQSIV